MVIQKVQQKELMPIKLKESFICPKHKKGDNYWEIALVNMVYKIVTVVIKNKVNYLVEKKVDEP